jgi:hypothetical protein
MDNFYVYMYLRANDSEHGKAGSPYYIGKGKGMRAFDKNHRCKPPSDFARIVFVVRDVSESAAHAEEKRLIAIYGRIDNGTGCLANLTDGGEGQCGRIMPPEERRRKSEWMKAHPNEGNRLLAVTCHTPEARAKAAASNRGQKRTPEYCNAASERMAGKSAPWAIGNKYSLGNTHTEEWKEEARERGKNRIAPSTFTMAGRHHREESREKSRESNLNAWTPEKRAEHGEMMKALPNLHIPIHNTPHSQASIEKMRQSHSGSKASEETKAKMAISQQCRVREVLTHCKSGHPRTPENIRANGKGCVLCHRQWAQRNKAVQQESQRCGLSAA